MVEAAGIGLSPHFVRSRNRRLLQLSLQSVFSIPLKTCIQHVFIVVITLLFFPSSSRAIGHLFSRRARSLGYNVTFHGLRHIHVSMLIKAGVPINTISARVGHSTPSITHDIYAHLLPGMGRHAVDLFESMLLKQSAQIS